MSEVQKIEEIEHILIFAVFPVDIGENILEIT
jgi:hypothetical protein